MVCVIRILCVGNIIVKIVLFCWFCDWKYKGIWKIENIVGKVVEIILCYLLVGKVVVEVVFVCSGFSVSVFSSLGEWCMGFGVR